MKHGKPSCLPNSWDMKAIKSNGKKHLDEPKDLQGESAHNSNRIAYLSKPCV